MAKRSKATGFEAVKNIAKPMGIKNPGGALAAVAKASKAAGKPTLKRKR
jgi:hypothetical protein